MGGGAGHCLHYLACAPGVRLLEVFKVFLGFLRFLEVCEGFWKSGREPCLDVSP